MVIVCNGCWSRDFILMCIKTLWMQWEFLWGISEVHPTSHQVATIITHVSNMCPSKISLLEGIKWWKTRWEFTQSRSPTCSTHQKKYACGAGIQRLCEAPAFKAGVPIVCQIFARKAGQRAFADWNKLAHQQGMIRNMWQPFPLYTFELRSHSRHVLHHNKHRRRGQTTYLILPDVAPSFFIDLQRSRQKKWLHATCYDELHVVYLDEQTKMWILVQYAQHWQTRHLWIETQIGQPSSRIITLCQTWKGPEIRESELNETWLTYTPSLDTVSDPVDAAIFIWGSLWSHSDRRVTGEATGFLRLIACALLQNLKCPVQHIFSELGENSAQTHWLPRIRTDSKGNKKVKRVDLKQPTVQLMLPPANVQKSFRQVLTSETVPNTRHWQCNDHATVFIDGIGTPHTPSRQSRVVSQNDGPVGIRNSIPTVQRILSSHHLAVVLLKTPRKWQRK